MSDKKSNFHDNTPDIKKLIRSIQRLEGNPDCFYKSEGFCDQIECAWREYCIDKSLLEKIKI